MRAVVALGGNALVRKGQRGTLEEQRSAVRAAAASIAELIAADIEVIVIHGNGPQVGRLLLQQRCAEDVAPAMPLDVLVAQTQGELGYLLQQSLSEALVAAGLSHTVVTVVTQVVVRRDDPAFAAPDKPIGPHYRAADLDAAGATVAGDERVIGEVRYREVAGGGWRQVVASPQPIDVIEADALRRLLAAPEGAIVAVCGGGGGIPVVRRDGKLAGVVAVVDKDRTAALLARLLEADLLLVLTDVDAVRLDYGTPAERVVRRLTVAQVEELSAAGQFAAGSMQPKVTAAAEMVRRGGRAVIAALDDAMAAVEGSAGTEVVP